MVEMIQSTLTNEFPINTISNVSIVSFSINVELYMLFT